MFNKKCLHTLEAAHPVNCKHVPEASAADPSASLSLALSPSLPTPLPIPQHMPLAISPRLLGRRRSWCSVDPHLSLAAAVSMGNDNCLSLSGVAYTVRCFCILYGDGLLLESLVGENMNRILTNICCHQKLISWEPPHLSTYSLNQCFFCCFVFYC